MTAWNAADYAKHSTAQQQWARELIAKLALRGDERVLDVGCGDGKVTAEIAAAVPRGSVVGVDRSHDMIRFAREQFGKVANLSFEPGDAGALSFAGEFDAVFSNAVLHWVRNHRPVLRGIAAALRPGGRALLQMGGRGNAAPIVEAFAAVTARPEWAGFFAGFEFPYGFYGPDEYRGWLAEAGLRGVRAELIPKDMRYAEPAGLLGWLRTTWMPWTDRVPAERADTLLGDVLNVYLAARPPDGDGAVHVPMVRLEVEAVRE